MHPNSRGRRRASQEITKNKTKDANVDTDINMKSGYVKLSNHSVPSLNTIMGQIHESANRELRFPNAARTFKKMSLDPNIASAISLTEAVIAKAEWKVGVGKKASESDKKAAEMLNYNILIMDRSFREYVSEMLSYLTYGYHVSEKCYKRFKDTPVGDFIGLRDLLTISQDSVSKWVFDESTGEFLGIRQRPINDTSNLITRNTSSEVDVPKKKLIHIAHNAKRNNPEGTSPLVSCYIGWKYKTVLEEMETIYASKGLGGVLDLGVDVSYIAKASANPSGPEANVLQQMMSGAANFHNGDQSYIITPIAYDDKGKELFYTRILDTQPPEIDVIIKRHDHRILQTFFADVLMLGSDGSGSFALSEDKSTLLMIGIKQHLNRLREVLNRQIIEQFYYLNDIPYDARTACYFEYNDVEDGDIDILSSAVQRVMAVGAVDPTEDIEDFIRDKIFDLPARSETKTKVRENAENKSRSGDGMTSGLPNGVGDSTAGGGDRTIANKEK